MRRKIPRILFASTASGAGKTTITCAVLQALHYRGLKVSSFKCGPDYIDPMFHREGIHIPSHNLDLFFLSENTAKALLAENGGEDCSVLEGVMGYYDGLALTGQASSYHLAKATKTPVILIVNCKGMSSSIAAQVQGFVKYEQDSGMKGVLLNQISPGLYPEVKKLIEERIGVKVYGFFPKMKQGVLKSRQLGLIPSEEVDGILQTLQQLAEQAEQTIDLDELLKLSHSAEELEWEPLFLPEPLQKPVRIGIARDRAFCFYYAENLRLLEKLGAELIPFSPMQDPELPKNLDGVLFGGGYPEVFAKGLSENIGMRKDVQQHLGMGLPCLAECGGFQYLQRTIEGEDRVQWEMVNALPSYSFNTGGLCRFGYAMLTMKQDTILGPKGTTLPFHEFHHWDSTNPGNACSAQKIGKAVSWECIVAKENLFAGYPHLHYYSNPQTAKRFLECCAKYQQKRKTAK